MTAGDPSVYWTQVYSEGNTRITRSPTNKYAFLEEGMKFIFFSSKEKLQEIATSDYQESCKLVSDIFNEFSTGKR